MTGRHPLIWAAQPDGTLTALAPDGGRYTLTRSKDGSWYATWQPRNGALPAERLPDPRTDRPTLDGAKAAAARHAPSVPLYRPTTTRPRRNPW